jgi:SAM-dependent methyltransferase
MEGSTENSGLIAYEALAGTYDDFTAGYQAEAWTAKLEAKVARWGISGRRLLDVGCGTGKSFLPMRKRGWEVVGCDVSPAMLEIAREKVDDAVPLHVADVRELPTLGEFDLIWALNDTLNYLMSEGELEAALVGMRGNLSADGILLFDLNTFRSMREMFTNETVREVSGREMRWAGQASEGVEPGGVNTARFEVVGDPSASHDHRQRHFPEASVLQALTGAELKCLEVWGDYEGEQDQPLDEDRHQKAIYIARSASGA